MHRCDLMYEERHVLLELYMFLKQNQNVKIRGHTVAGGNKYRTYITKEDISSATVSTESVLLLIIVEAKENRYAAVIDIPNAFLQM